MGFPGEEAAWSSVAGAAIYPGADGSMPGVWSVIAIIACIATLWIGHSSEAKKYKNAS